MGRLRDMEGLYVERIVEGVHYRALVNTGSTITLIKHGMLPTVAISAMWVSGATEQGTVLAMLAVKLQIKISAKDKPS